MLFIPPPSFDEELRKASSFESSGCSWESFLDCLPDASLEAFVPVDSVDCLLDGLLGCSLDGSLDGLLGCSLDGSFNCSLAFSVPCLTLSSPVDSFDRFSFSSC